MAPALRISKWNPCISIKNSPRVYCEPQYGAARPPNESYSHVRMPPKTISFPSNDASNRRRGMLCQIIEFPKPFVAEVRQRGLTIIFELDERRFATGWDMTELNQKPGELIPILRKDTNEES
jgi:hypothetical protein